MSQEVVEDSTEQALWHKAHLYPLNHKVDRSDYKHLRSPELEAKRKDKGILPAVFDLKSWAPLADDQGELGSCVSHAVAKVLEFNLRKKNAKDVASLSRLYIYWFGRWIEANSPKFYIDPGDTGLPVIDGFRSATLQSVCLQSLWPYTISKFKIKPTTQMIASALKSYKLTNYFSVGQSVSQIKTALSSGYPVVFGFEVYSSFMTASVAKTGKIPVPNVKKETFLGGHCMGIYGWNDSQNSFLILNSWGTSWGLNGYAWFPYAYMVDGSLTGEFFSTSSFSNLNPILEPGGTIISIPSIVVPPFSPPFRPFAPPPRSSSSSSSLLLARDKKEEKIKVIIDYKQISQIKYTQTKIVKKQSLKFSALSYDSLPENWTEGIDGLLRAFSLSGVVQSVNLNFVVKTNQNQWNAFEEWKILSPELQTKWKPFIEEKEPGFDFVLLDFSQSV